MSLADLRAETHRCIERARRGLSGTSGSDALDALAANVDGLLDRVAAAEAERDTVLRAAEMAAEASVMRIARAEAERDALDRARLAALRAVASVLTVLGDDAPATLIDAHRFLATGRTDEDRAVLAAPVPAAPTPTKETPA